MNKLTITLPTLHTFSDYHDIEEFANDLCVISGQKVKSHELPYEKYLGYIGLFYIGKRPSKSEIKKMLEDYRGTCK